MPWHEMPVTGGVVLTRDASALSLGELQSSANLRLRPNDLRQLHTDNGRSRISEFVGALERIVGMRAMTFEVNGTLNRYLFAVTTDLTSSYLRFSSLDSGTWYYVGSDPSSSSEATLTGQATAVDFVHTGNEYVVLTDIGNYVLYATDNLGILSRPMGLSGATSPPDGDAIGTAPLTAGTGHNQYDYYAYVFNEYDSTHDVESAPVAYLTFPTTTDDTLASFDLLTGGYDQVNSTADKLRLYRTFIGNTGGSDSALAAKATRIALGLDPRLMGLIDEFKINTLSVGSLRLEPYAVGNLDTSVQYPLVKVDGASIGIYEYLVKPGNATLGALFYNSLILNKPSVSKQVLYYSPPNAYEYQPAPYIIPIVSESSDTIVGYRQVNDVLIALTTSAAFRISGLPLIGLISGRQGEVLASITSKHGCVGRKAFTKIETSQGELMVWVSSSGIMWSNGYGWDDACPDFSLHDAQFDENIPTTVLINNPTKFRLELYQPAQPSKNIAKRRWDLYYHPSLLKNGKLRLMGPTYLPPATGETLYASSIIDATTIEVDGKYLMYTTDGASVWKEGTGLPNEDTSFETGHLTAQSRFNALEVTGAGLTHSSSTKELILGGREAGKIKLPTYVGAESKLTLTAAIKGDSPVPVDATLPDGLKREETSEVIIENYGNWVTARWIIEALPFSVGPAWVQATEKVVGSA